MNYSLLYFDYTKYVSIDKVVLWFVMWKEVNAGSFSCFDSFVVGVFD
jgi:hypothetical protein